MEEIKIQDKYKIKDLRDLVNYNDKTPNEPRINNNDLIDDKEYYPLGNTYINKYNNSLLYLPSIVINNESLVDKEWFERRLKDQQLQYAIQYLQVNALEKFIVKNYKSILFTNPFYQLFYTEYPINKNMEATEKIINILIQNYDNYYELIDNLIPPKKEQQFILNLMYSFLPNDENNLCSICLHTEPKKFLINICKCTTPTHANCLIELNKYNKLKNCMVCKNKYKISEPIYRTISGINIKSCKDDTLYFPYNDLYYQPLINDSSLVKVTGMSRLTMAIMYLQVNRVAELLQDNEILEQLPNYYFGYDGYKQTPIIALATGNMASNCNIEFGDNIMKYLKIMKLLIETQKIDLTAKDAFNKSAIDYVNKYNYQIFRYCGLR